jgi:CHASE3 domain sensor protein
MPAMPPLSMDKEERFWDAVAAVERARGVRITQDARKQLSGMLTEAVGRISRGEATEEQFDAATDQLKRGLMEAQLAMMSDGGAVLNALGLREALRSLCPLWPFC